MKSKSIFKRKVLIINPKFQWGLVVYNLATTATVLAIFGVANLYFFEKFRRTADSLGLPRSHLFFQFIDDQAKSMLLIFLIAAAFVIGIIIATSVVMSHRIAGPLYRLNRHMRENAAAGQLSPVRFRALDYFQELSEAYNLLIKK